MKRTAMLLTILTFIVGAPVTAQANCADDAIDTCNTKHPNPNKSDHAYELYELCIKAKLGQQCPTNASIKGGLIKNLKSKSLVRRARAARAVTRTQ